MFSFVLNLLPLKQWPNLHAALLRFLFLSTSHVSISVKFCYGFSTSLSAETCCNLFYNYLYIYSSKVIPPKKCSYQTCSTNPVKPPWLSPGTESRQGSCQEERWQQSNQEQLMTQYYSTLHVHFVRSKTGRSRGIGGEDTAQFKPFTPSSYSRPVHSRCCWCIIGVYCPSKVHLKALIMSRP